MKLEILKTNIKKLKMKIITIISYSNMPVCMVSLDYIYYMHNVTLLLRLLNDGHI